MYELAIGHLLDRTDLVNSLISVLNRTPSQRLRAPLCLNLGEHRLSRSELYQMIQNIKFYKRSLAWFINSQNCPELFFDKQGLAEEDPTTFEDPHDLYLQMNSYLKI